MAVNRSFWKNKPVFLTGHTGFKGGWLSLWLQTLGARVSGYALTPLTQPNLFNVARVDEAMESYIGNVLDASRLFKVMKAEKPSVAFHLAAQPLVGNSFDDPVQTFAVNVMGTVNFLEAVRKVSSIRVAVVITSDKCYKIINDHLPYSEEDAMGGNDPYSCSKGCAELVVNSYRDSFFKNSGCNLASVRAGNVVGGGDWSDHRLIPDLIRSFCEKKKLYLRYPTAVRPWQHVLDPLCGYMKLAEKLWETKDHFARGWNFGPSERERTVLDIVNKAAKIMGNGGHWVQAETRNHEEPEHLLIDSNLAREKLGWQCRLKFDEMIAWTFRWYHHHLNSDDMRRYTIQQINQYSMAQ